MSYLSPETLELSQAQFDALKTVMEAMRAGKFYKYEGDTNPGLLPFCFDYWNNGCAACIGGWMEHAMKEGELRPLNGPDPRKYVGADFEGKLVDKLFFPKDVEYHTVGVKEAAQGIENFLVHGDPDWLAIDGVGEVVEEEEEDEFHAY